MPLLLQLPVSLLDWWAASRVCGVVQEHLGLRAANRQQLLVEALLTLGLPWGPFLLQLLLQRLGLLPRLGSCKPHRQRRAGGRGQAQQGALESLGAASSSSSSRGAAKQAPLPHESCVAPASGKQLQLLRKRCRHPHTQASPHPAPGRPGSGALSNSCGDSSSDSSYSSDSGSSTGPAHGAATSSSGADIPSRDTQARSSQQLQPVEAAQRPATDVAGGGVPRAPAAGWEPPAAGAGQPGVSDMDSATLLLGPLRYEPCCRVVPISLKVSRDGRHNSCSPLL